MSSPSTKTFSGIFVSYRREDSAGHAAALRREIRVIPVLVQRASLPKAQELPEDLVKLIRRNAVELTDLRWQTDVDQLISVMERVLAKRAEAEQLGEANHVKNEVQRYPEVQEQRCVVEREPAPVVSAVTASRAKKHLIPIAGVSLVLLLAMAILIWQSQTGDPQPGNTTQEAATPTQTSVPTATPATPDESANVAASGGEQSIELSHGLWKRDDNGDVLQVSQKGNNVIAVMYGPSEAAVRRGRKRGDLAFEGLIDGNTITGTAYLLFSSSDVERCPGLAGDHRFALELTLSADGNTLSGTREDFELSSECNITKLPSKSLTYTRLSR